jgi:hypothetical protein
MPRLPSTFHIPQICPQFFKGSQVKQIEIIISGLRGWPPVWLGSRTCEFPLNLPLRLREHSISRAFDGLTISHPVTWTIRVIR